MSYEKYGVAPPIPEPEVGFLTEEEYAANEVECDKLWGISQTLLNNIADAQRYLARVDGLSDRETEEMLDQIGLWRAELDEILKLVGEYHY